MEGKDAGVVEDIDLSEFVPIIGFENEYMISMAGEVYSIRNNAKIIFRRAKNGYFKISFSVNGKKSYFSRHRLVAIAFIPNPDNKPFINHINGIPGDDRLENLEWCTAKENTQHSFTVLGRIIHNRGFTGYRSNRKNTVYQYNDNNQCIDAFFSTRDAERKTGICHVSINFACSGKYKKAGGFIWKY